MLDSPSFLYKHQQKIALVCTEMDITYEALGNEVSRLYNCFDDLPNGVAILTASNSLSFIYTFLAFLTRGKPVAIFSPNTTTSENLSRRELLGSAFEVDTSGNVVWQSKNLPVKHHPDAAVILFTSGSNGQPKAVQLSKRNIAANIEAVISSLEFDLAQDQLLFLSLSYSYGLLGQLLPALYQGMKTVLLNDFSEIRSVLSADPIPAMWSGTPSHWAVIARMVTSASNSFSQISHIISAGAPFSLQLRQELKQRFPHATIYNNYGLTEASPRVLSFSSHDPKFFECGVGYPVGKWKIDLTNDSELIIKGPQVMLGYLNDGDDKKAKIRNGWLYTSDIAKIGENGLVEIIGRKDNIYNIAGERVSITELENAMKALPYIEDAAVFAQDDNLYGVIFVAVLVPVDLTSNTEKLKERLLVELALKLSSQKIPKEIYIREELPKNQNGKIDRQAIMSEQNLRRYN